jgi:hypothetical protein
MSKKREREVPKNWLAVDRTHKECADCIKLFADPPQCKGHCAGPSPCIYFKATDEYTSAECEEVYKENECIKDYKFDPKSKYYSAGDIGVLDIIKAKLTPEQYKGYLLGTNLVYLLRMNWKHKSFEDKLRDVEKAGIYNKWLFEHMSEEIKGGK